MRQRGFEALEIPRSNRALTDTTIRRRPSEWYDVDHAVRRQTLALSVRALVAAALVGRGGGPAEVGPAPHRVWVVRLHWLQCFSADTGRSSWLGRDCLL